MSEQDPGFPHDHLPKNMFAHSHAQTPSPSSVSAGGKHRDNNWPTWPSQDHPDGKIPHLFKTWQHNQDSSCPPVVHLLTMHTFTGEYTTRQSRSGQFTTYSYIAQIGYTYSRAHLCTYIRAVHDKYVEKEKRKCSGRIVKVRKIVWSPEDNSIHQWGSSSAASCSTRSSITSLWGRPRPRPAATTGEAASPVASPCISSCRSSVAPVFTGTSGALRGSNPGAIRRSASRFRRCFSSSRAWR